MVRHENSETAPRVLPTLPEGRLILREGVLAAIALFCLVLAAALIGFNFFMVAWVGAVGGLLLWFTYFKKPPTS